MRVRGLMKVEARIKAAVEEIESNVRRGIKDVSFDLLRRAQELAPVETGDLRGSGSVDFSEDENTITAYIGFNTPYAVRQHEELTYNHPQGGQAKYLQQPFEEKASDYEKHILEEAKKGAK